MHFVEDISSSEDWIEENSNMASSSSETAFCNNDKLLVNLDCCIKILLEYVSCVIGFDESGKNFIFQRWSDTSSLFIIM